MFRSWLVWLGLALPALSEAWHARLSTVDAPRSEHAGEADLAAAALPQGSLRVPIPIQNPGAETGNLIGWSPTPFVWFPSTQLKRSGNWSAKNIDHGSRGQVIDLIAAGFTPAELDRSPALEVRDHVRAFIPDPTSYYYLMHVELLDASGAVLAMTYKELLSAEITAQWKECALSLSGYPSGVRMLRITETVTGFPMGVHLDDISATFLLRKRKL